MKSVLALLIAACFFTACSSGKKFTTRKYTSGRYVSHAVHKDRISSRQKAVEKPVAIAGKDEVVHRNNAVVLASAETAKEPGALLAVQAPVKSRAIYKGMALHVEKLEKNRLLQTLNKGLSVRSRLQAGTVAPAESSSQALVGVILSGLGVILDVAGLVVLFSVVDYVFLLCTLLGLALGIVGLILGLSSIKKYREERRNGNKNTTMLVLGIVGASVGGLAILLGLVYSLVGALLLSI